MKIVLVELRHGTTRGVGDGTRAVASPPRALFRAKESIRRVQHRGERLRGGTVPGVVRSSRPLEPLVHGRVRRASKPRPPPTRARRRALKSPPPRARARRRRRPIPLRQVPPIPPPPPTALGPSCESAATMHSSIHVSVASSRPDPGEDADPPTGEDADPPAPPSPSAPRPPVLPRGYPTTFRVRLFRADRPGDSRSVTLDDPRSVSPRLFFERALEPVGERGRRRHPTRVRQQRNERGDERRPRRDARAKRAHSRRAKRLSHRALARLRRRRRRARQRVPSGDDGVYGRRRETRAPRTPPIPRRTSRVRDYPTASPQARSPRVRETSPLCVPGTFAPGTSRRRIRRRRREAR